MKILQKRLLGGITGLTMVGVLTLGLGITSAQADTVKTIDSAAITRTGTSLSVNLANLPYATTPTGIYISFLRNGGGDGCDPIRTYVPAPNSYCWSSSEKSYPSNNVRGTFTADDLKPGLPHLIEVRAYEGNTQEVFYGVTSTLATVPTAPSGPSYLIAKNGLSAKLTVETEISDWNINDSSTTLAGLKYTIYAHYKGVWHKVAANLRGGQKVNLTKLPLNTNIVFAETDTNSVGESSRSTQNPGAIKLTATAPAATSFRGVIYPTYANITWKAPAPGAGHIIKYVVTAKNDLNKIIYKHTFGKKTRSVSIKHLQRGHVYYFTVTAYNSYGKHTSNEKVGQSK